MAAGNTGALSLFDLNATVGLSAEGFTTALEGLQTKITNFSDKVQNVITKIGNFEHGLSAISSDDATGIENVTTTLSNLDEAAVTAYGSVAELDDSVSNASASADIGATKWERFAHSVSTAYGAIKKVGTIAWDVGSGLVQSAASWENQEYLFGTVFGDEAGAAQRMLDYYSELYNIHERRLKGNMAAINRQLTSAEVDPDKKFTYTTQALLVATVAASAYGTTIDDATSRLLSFMRGNVEAGETIGLFTNQLARENIAAELYGTSWDEISEAQREIALLTIATRTMSEYQNVPIERANSYANALQNLQVQWEEVRATLGAPILNAVTPIMQELSEWLEENPDKVQSVAEAIGSLAEGVAALVVETIGALADNPDILNYFLDGLMEFASNIASLLEFLGPIIAWIPEKIGYVGGKVSQAFETSQRVDHLTELLTGTDNLVEQYFIVTSASAASGENLATKIGNLYRAVRSEEERTAYYAALDRIDALGNQEKFNAIRNLLLLADEYGDLSTKEQKQAKDTYERRYAELTAAMSAMGMSDAEIGRLRDYIHDHDVEGDEMWIGRKHGWNKNDPGVMPTDAINWVIDNFDFSSPDVAEGISGKIDALPDEFSAAITAALPAALAGVGVYMDGQLVGHLVAPTVMGDMARSARNNMHTGTNT